jgi:RNA polymerase sigma-70 factor (ECF subfamily)
MTDHRDGSAQSGAVECGLDRRAGIELRSAVAEDAELLEAWSKGDQRAARALFDRYFPALFRFFHGKVDQPVEDLVQETFMACVDAPDRFRGEGLFRSYLFGTARNVLRQHYRRWRRKEGKLDLGVVSVHDLGVGQSTALADKAEHRLLLEGLRRLPLDRQIALELHLWEGMSAREIGVLFAVGEEAARSKIRRARDELRRHVLEVASSRAVLESTLTDLEGWARSLREHLEAKTG